MPLPLFFRTHARALIQASILLGAGLGIGLLVLPPRPVTPDLKAPAPEVTLLGERLDVNSDKAPVQALEIARKYAAGTMTVQVAGGPPREVPRAALGAEIDKVRLGQMIQKAAKYNEVFLL